MQYLREICLLMKIPASNPQRGFVSHRWLSAYDASLRTSSMLPAYKVLYYGYLSVGDKELYQEPLEALYGQYSVSQEGKSRVRWIHDDLKKKGEEH